MKSDCLIVLYIAKPRVSAPKKFKHEALDTEKPSLFCSTQRTRQIKHEMIVPATFKIE